LAPTARKDFFVLPMVALLEKEIPADRDEMLQACNSHNSIKRSRGFEPWSLDSARESLVGCKVINHHYPDH